MKNIKSILTLTLIGGSIILTGCSGNTEASAKKANNQQTTQAQATSNNSASNYNVDMTSLEKDLKALEEGKYNGKWEDELEAKYGDDFDDLMEQKHGDNWDDLFEAELMK